MNTEPKDTSKGGGPTKAIGDDAFGGQSQKVRIRVLIADDHGVVREGLASMINRNGAVMTVAGEASNGREALELWQQERPDVMLLDLRMPELDGVIKRLPLPFLSVKGQSSRTANPSLPR